MTILITAIIWWTISVVLLMLIFNEQSHDGLKGFAETIAVATLWPIFVPFVALELMYQSLVKSTAQIRADLHNRKLLAEFEAWLKERNKQ